MQPKEEQAEKAIYKAQQYFAEDSSYKVLHGDGVNKGVLTIISNYNGTKTANLAKFYAGVSYLKLGKFSDAVNQLKDFTTDSKPVQMKAYGCLGDAYSELNKKAEAIDAYKKAASAFEADETNAAEYLFRAALLSEVSGNSKEALDLYKQLKDKFPATMRGSQADKYIYRLSIEPNEFSSK
jgi:tetratricopeptide (TPR) repeat protein